MNNFSLNSGEVLEDLCLDGLKIIQSPALYRFTSDAVILANFVHAKQTHRLLDLGTGSGIIAILATHKNNLCGSVGVELQEELCSMATRSVALNRLADRIQIINANIKTFKATKPFDVVTCNPPYKKTLGLKISDNPSRAMARHEVAITLAEICKCASQNLKFGGKFYVCMHADRAAELLCELSKCNLQPKKMFFAAPQPNSIAKTIFVMAQKGGKIGVQVLPTVITNSANGQYLEEVKKRRF